MKWLDWLLLAIVAALCFRAVVRRKDSGCQNCEFRDRCEKDKCERDKKSGE